jgi:hypothetical protein
MKTITDKAGWKVTYDDSPKLHKAVFDKLMKDFFLKHQAYLGESITQCDDPQIEAPQILANLADKIIKFKVKYND